MAKLLHKDPEVRMRLRPAMNHLWFRDKLDGNNYSEVDVRDKIDLLEPGTPAKLAARKALGGSRSLNRPGAGAASAEQRPRRGAATGKPGNLRRPMRDLFVSAKELKIDPTSR